MTLGLLELSESQIVQFKQSATETVTRTPPNKRLSSKVHAWTFFRSWPFGVTAHVSPKEETSCVKTVPLN